MSGFRNLLEAGFIGQVRDKRLNLAQKCGIFGQK
jgi:hypothetical protein